MRIKKICVGIAVSILLTGSIVFADDFVKTIEVKLNSINIQVNGKTVGSDNILYNGRTYVQLRDVAEMFNSNVNWIENTKTANITNYSTDLNLIKDDINKVENYLFLSNKYKEINSLANKVSYTNTLLYYDLVQSMNTKNNSKSALEHIDICKKDIKTTKEFINRAYKNHLEYNKISSILTIIENSIMNYSQASEYLAKYCYSKSITDEDFNLYSNFSKLASEQINEAISLSDIAFSEIILEAVKLDIFKEN